MKLMLIITAVLQLTVRTQPAVLPQVTLSVVVPQSDTSKPSVAWKRGLEVLPGARIARESINAHNGTLCGCSLELHTINGGDCEAEAFLFLPPLLRSYQQSQFAGAIKQFCSTAIQFIPSPFKESAITAILPQFKDDSHLISALVGFVNQMNWTQIGIITELSNTFFSYTAEVFHQAAKESDVVVTSFTQLHHQQSVDLSKQPKVILVSLSAPLAREILCRAYKSDQQWPMHAWILHSYWLDDFLGFDEESPCNMSKAMEGVVLVRDKLQPRDGHFKLHTGEQYEQYQQKYKEELAQDSKKYDVQLKPNPYANALHDAVWLAALALNASGYGQGNCTSEQKVMIDNFTFAGAQGYIKVDGDGSMQRKIDVVRIKGSQEIHVGQYDLNSVFVNMSLLMDAPAISVHITGGSTAYTAGLAFEIVITFIVVTTFLFLYIYFREEPEVKSTSLTLSLFMYLSCYLTLVYLVLLLLSDQPSDTGNYSYYANLCPILQWTSGLGIPLPLITGTMLIKLVRIHYIFKKFSKTGPAPVGRQCSDAVLGLLVLLTITPNVLILIIWTGVDNYGLVTEERGYRDGTLVVDKQCTSDYLLMWIGGWVVCLFVLLLALLVVAVKTRKIRLRHYKDTKKVNAFIFILNLNIFFTLCYWALLREITLRHITGIISHIGHSALVIFCQVFLFAPKVFPPALRRLSLKLRSSAEK